jgi:hypothetical protein
MRGTPEDCTVIFPYDVHVLSPQPVAYDEVMTAEPEGRAGAAVVVGTVLLVVALAAALSVDVVKDGYGVKSDEATYVSMALSAAYDHDLTYERRDLERFFGLYRDGPNGIFLKRGKQLRIDVGASPPFVHLRKKPDLRSDRFYFAKSLIYPVVAAPFVRLFGLNGFLVLHVLLMFAVCVCGYLFLAARSHPGPALAFTVAFVAATCVPVYLVMVTPEVLNFALVFVAYFLWLYKEVAPSSRYRSLLGFGSDVCAAILLGVATYSKVSHALLVGPIVLWWWWRRRYFRGLIVGVACVAATAALFGVTALNSGEFNFQGGDRKTFYGAYPFDGAAKNAWDEAKEMTTNDSDADNVFTDFGNRFAHNVEYFIVGRHFGFALYFFPGVVAFALWLGSRERRQPWRVFIALTFVGTATALLVFAPYSWSGGGGPYGNRYFMSVYPVVFFLLPPLRTATPALVAWIGGALFTAKALVDPFYAAKNPQLVAARGFVRSFPVEVTMANDLPIALDPARAHLWFSDVLLSFLDKHAYIPETINASGEKGIWVAGDGRADILMRSEWPIDHLTMTAESPVRTVFTVSAGSRASTVEILPGRPVTFDLAVSGVYGLNSHAYLLSARSSEGFVPHLRDPLSTDFRNLGVLMRFRAVPVREGG